MEGLTSNLNLQKYCYFIKVTATFTKIRFVLLLFSFFYSSMTLQTLVGPSPLLQFHNLFYTDSRTSWTGISPPQGSYLHTEQYKHRINAHNTDIHALSAILTHDPIIRASEDSSCLRPRGHCDRHYIIIIISNSSSNSSSRYMM
jgi:hypothetical protein